MNLRVKDFSDLKITNEIVLYIGYDGVMGRVIIGNKAAADLRTYYGGKEVKVDHALPYNGSVWFRQAGTGQLYRAALDGQLAIRLTEEKALCFTLAQLGDEVRLLYADAQQQLHSIGLTDGDKQPVGTLKASALNANEEYVFFADAKNKHRLSMFRKDDPGEIILLSDMAVDQIYAFDNYVAFQKKGSKSLYLMALNSEGKAVLISK
jgi:hypothetical protein